MAFREVIFTSEYVALSEEIDLIFLLLYSYPQTSRTDVPRRLHKILSFSKQTYADGCSDMSICTHRNAVSLQLLILAINLVSHRLYQIATRQSLYP